MGIILEKKRTKISKRKSILKMKPVLTLLALLFVVQNFVAVLSRTVVSEEGDKIYFLLTGEMCFKENQILCRAYNIAGADMDESSNWICAPKDCKDVKECKEGKVSYRT